MNQCSLSMLVLLSSMLTVGCQHPDAKKLIGVWEIEAAQPLYNRLHQAVDTAAENVSQADEIDAGSHFESPTKRGEFDASSQMQVQFRSNGTWVTQTEIGRVAPAPKLGRWEMIGFDPVTRMMTVRCEQGTDQSEHEIEFLDEDRIRMTPPNMAGLTLKLTFARVESVRRTAGD